MTVESTFVLHANKRDALTAKAVELGLELQISEISKDELCEWHYHNLKGGAAFSLPDLGADLLARARKLAARDVGVWLRVTAAAPWAGDEQLVACAESLGEGQSKFSDLSEGVADYWTGARMDALDYRRCDECCKAIRRTKVFVVRHGETLAHRQLGGSCAKGPAEALRRHLKALRALAGWLGKSGDGEDSGGYSSARNTDHLGAVNVLVLADWIIQRNGYASRNAVREGRAMQSTADLVGSVISAMRNSPRSPEAKEGGEALRAAYASGYAAQLFDDATAMAAAKLAGVRDEAFPRNLVAALETGHVKMLAILCWAPAGVAAWKADKLRAAMLATASAWTPAHPPKKGARVKTVDGTWMVVSHKVWDGTYGATAAIHFLRKSDSAVLFWKASNWFDDNSTPLRVGDLVTLKALSVTPKVEPARYGMPEAPKVTRVAWARVA